MITDGKKWHCFAVKELSELFKEITANHNEDFYCLNCLHSFRTEKHKNICKNHNDCYIKMPKEYNNILKYNHGEKSIKIPFIIMLG